MGEWCDLDLRIPGPLNRRFTHTGTQDLEKNPPRNAEDNLRAGLIVIEAWFGGY